MAEIEKGLIKPTFEEWKTIFEQSKPKLIYLNIKREGIGRATNINSKSLSEFYEALIREQGGSNVDETLRNLVGEGAASSLRRLGFNSSKEAKWVIDALKNPALNSVTLFVDANDEIEKIDYAIKGEVNTVQHPVIYDKIAGDRISFDSRRYYRIDNSKDLIVEPLTVEYINLFDFDNTERIKVSYIKSDKYSIDPSTLDVLNSQTNFLPTKKVITNDFSEINTLQEYNNFYLIKPKALNKLMSGKKVKPVIVKSIEGINSHKENIQYKGINFVHGQLWGEDDDRASDSTPLLNLVNQPLESIPNYFKENINRDKLNEVLTPNSVNKITSRLQYEVRLQGRQTREGRGEGKYTGDRDTKRNTQSMGFVLYHIENKYIYFPKMKEEIPLYIVVFYNKQYPYGEETWFPADKQMLFYNESEVGQYFGEKSMSNKDWIKVSKNITRDTVNGVVSYLKSLKVSYRVKGKLDLSKFTPEVQDKINNNIKDIVENSMFGFLSQTKRRGRRMVVKKNLLKSASDIKRVSNSIIKDKFGPLKEFKDLSKYDMQIFVNSFRNSYGQEYEFENTEFNLEYIFEPLAMNEVTNNLKETSNTDITNLTSKIQNLDGDIFQCFSISSKVKNRHGEIGMGVLVFCYFFKDDKLDKIEAVVASISRYSTLNSKNRNTINVSKKEISIEYPFDDMGVFMYEIVTGGKYSIMMRGTGGDATTNSPPRRASTYYEGVLNLARRFGNILVDRIQFNDLRNEHVGYVAGRNPNNAMYYYLYTDSDYSGGSEEGQLCVGKIDLLYRGVKEGARGRPFDNIEISLSKYPTLQSFKDAFSVAIVATDTGSCLQGGPIPKGDTAGTMFELYVGGTGVDYDKNFSYRNIKDNKERVGLAEGMPNDRIAEGVAGQRTYRVEGRLKTHLSLVRLYGQEFLNWTDSLVKKVLESNEIKIGGKNISSGTSSGGNFKLNSPNSAIAHEPENSGQEEPEDLSMYKRAVGIPDRLIPLFYNMVGREPLSRELEPFSDILETSNTFDEIIQRIRQFDDDDDEDDIDNLFD